MEFVRSVYRDNVTLRSVENVGKQYATGVELMINLDVLARWDVYLLGNLYDDRIQGSMNNIAFSEQAFTWNVRFNNTFILGPTTMLQANASYNSPSISSQGRREAYFVANVALRQEFFDRRLSATLDVSDALKTAERESTASGPDFSAWSYYHTDAPVVMLTLRYNLNATNNNRIRERNREQDFDDEEM